MHSLRMCYIRRLLQRQNLMTMQLKKGKMIGVCGGVPFEIFFLEKKPLQEMTRCGAPILQGICPSRTGELFEIGLKWDTVCARGL